MQFPYTINCVVPLQTNFMEEEVEYINPKAKFMCNTCYDKTNCKKDVFEMIFCKSDQIAMLTRKNNQLLTELIDIIKKINGV